MDVFVPILGRSGSETNGNLFFSLIIAGFTCILMLNGLVTYMTEYKKTDLILALVISFFLINPLIVFGFIGKIPYQEKTPMRLNLVVSLFIFDASEFHSLKPISLHYLLYLGSAPNMVRQRYGYNKKIRCRLLVLAIGWIYG